MSRLIRAALAAGCLASVPAAATEYTRFQPLRYAASPAGGDAAGCAGVALMNIPQAWQPGDAAVLLLADWTLRDARRDGLVAVLLQEGAAVVEVAAGAPTQCDGDHEATSRLAPPEDPIALMFTLLGAARREGAGLAVALGYGPGAGIAAQAAREDVAARHLPPGAPRFAAAAAIADGEPAFLLGPPAARRDAAPERLRHFCGALGQVADDAAETGRAEGRRIAALCLATLGRPAEVATAPR
jgi:hypothetical protein